MTKITDDRAYYRQLSNTDLIALTKSKPEPNWQELSIVLAERVLDLRYKLDCGHFDAQADRREWE